MPDVLDDLAWLLPGLKNLVSSPCDGGCFYAFGPLPVSKIVMHLNDHHEWSRVAIADWLDTLDVDLTFPTEPPPRPEPPPSLRFKSMSIDIGAKWYSAPQWASYSYTITIPKWTIFWGGPTAKPAPPTWIDSVDDTEQQLILNTLDVDDTPKNEGVSVYVDSFADLGAKIRPAIKTQVAYNPELFKWTHGDKPLVHVNSWDEKFTSQPARQRRKKAHQHV